MQFSNLFCLIIVFLVQSSKNFVPEFDSIHSQLKALDDNSTTFKDKLQIVMKMANSLQNKTSQLDTKLNNITDFFNIAFSNFHQNIDNDKMNEVCKLNNL